MPVITFSQWELGIDRRKGRSVSDANRLFDIRNGFVTTGWAIQKRPALTQVGELTDGSVGLMAFDGKLNTFSSLTDPGHVDLDDGVEVDNYQVPNSADANDEAQRIPFSEVFNGAIYVAVLYKSGTIEHHYITGASPWHITDVNNPQSAAGLRIAEKIFAIDGDVVAFSATGDPTDWTTADDAGFLPTGLRTPGTADALGLGEFNGQLAVFMTDAVQVWAVDPDPAQHGLDKTIPNIGTNYPRSIKSVADDLFFLAPSGYRSVALQKFTDNMIELDVGTPIDSIVTPLLTDSLTPIATYYSGGGQYWNAISAKKVHVYAWSRSAKLSAWSQYDLNIQVDDIAALGDTLYVRSGDNIYFVDPDSFTDNGEKFQVLIDGAFMNFKKPGVLKQITGVDVVAEGKGEIAHRYDASDPTKITDWVPFEGDTRSGSLIPVEVMATEIAPVIRSFNDGPFRLDAISYHYEDLGPF